MSKKSQGTGEESPASVTTEARLNPDAATELVWREICTHWGQRERDLFYDYYVKGAPPTQDKLNKLKVKYTKTLLSRQFNSLWYQLKGVVESWKKLQPVLLKDLETKLKQLEKKLTRMENKLASKRKNRNNLNTQKHTWLAKGKAWTEDKEAELLALRDGCKSLGSALHHKQRRLTNLKYRLGVLKEKGNYPPSICFGTRELFDQQFNLEEHGFKDHDAWLKVWRERRGHQYYLQGAADEPNGSQLAKYDLETGTLRLRVPKELVPKFGEWLVLNNVAFARDADLVNAYRQGKAVHYRLLLRETGVWYVQAMVDREDAPITTSLKRGAVAIDLNVGHLDVAETDPSGNLVKHWTVPFVTSGLSSGQAENLVGEALAAIILHAKKVGKPLLVENLDFRKKKASLREQGQHAKRLSEFVYSTFKRMAKARCGREGVEYLEVAPEYTSVIGAVKFMAYQISSHQAAALAIARRGMGLGEAFCIRNPSSRLVKAELVAKLDEIVKTRKREEPVRSLWKRLAPWLQTYQRKQARLRSVLSGSGSQGPPSSGSALSPPFPSLR